MSFKKKFHRIISMFCVAVLLLPMVLGLSVSAAEKRYLGYPVNLLIGKKLPVNSFVDEKGKAAKIEIAEGQYTLITYWASWCPDCQEELAYLPQLKEVLKDYPNVKWYLVDRVDGQDESIQSGSEYIKKLNLGLPVLYDQNLTFRNAIGIREIPTTILLNPQGELVLATSEIIKSQGNLRAMLDYATKGRGKATEDYVSKNLLVSDGSVKQSADSAKKSTQAQSILTEYAAAKKNTTILNQQKSWLAKNGGLTGDLGDDLRMYGAFSGVQGYEQDAKTLSAAIIKKYFQGNKLNGIVSLSDLNLEQISKLGVNGLADQALSVVQKGYISADFPFYYAQYNTKTGKYDQGVVDMTESLLTVYHLAKQGKVKQQTLDWLSNAVNTNGIFAKYKKDGTPVSRYQYETPGVYALTALIALETGEKSLFTQSVILMEKSRTFQTTSESNGAFSSKNRDKALDNCLPLLLYASMEQKGL